MQKVISTSPVWKHVIVYRNDLPMQNPIAPTCRQEPQLEVHALRCSWHFED